MKKICVIFTLLLLGTAFTIYAASGRESKQLPPQEVEIMYSSEDHMFQGKDINDVIRWKVMPDGVMATYDTSGSTTWRSGLEVGTVLTGTTGVGYTITGPSQGNIFYISTDATVASGTVRSSTLGYGSLDGNGTKAGITVWLPTTITEAMDNWKFTVFNTRSGTSEIVPYAATNGNISGVTFIGMSSPTASASGVTPGSAITGVTINSYGEAITFVAKYRATADMSGNTSVYYIQDYKVAIN